MKKGFCNLSVWIILLIYVCTGIAGAEVFTDRDTSFGLSAEEVKMAEPLPLRKSWDQELDFFGTVAGIQNTTVSYHFNSSGTCYSIIFKFNGSGSDISAVKNDFSAVNAVLQEKYGKPLGNTELKTDEYAGTELSTMILLESTFSGAGIPVAYDYAEWKTENEQGFVKIDHVSYAPGKKGAAISHILQYTLVNSDD